MTSTTESTTWDNYANVTSAWIDLWLQTYLPFQRIHHQIFKIASPFVLMFGIFGNSMVVLIMYRFTESNFGVFFQVLALSDQILLMAGLLPFWLHLAFDAPMLEGLGILPCKVTKMAITTTGTLSAWMLVALTMQRAASVLWPHRIGAVWTRKKSRIVSVVLVVVSAISNCHSLIGFVVDEKECAGHITKCCLVTESKAHRWFQYYISPWKHLAEMSFLPTILLIISNTVLLRKLVASIRSGKDLPLQQTTQDSRQRKVSSLIVTLLTISASFYLLTIPVHVFLIAANLLDPTAKTADPVVIGQYRIFEAASHVLWYSNSAVNFYLYCLTGRKFRAEFQNIASGFFSLFCKTKKVTSSHTSARSSTVAPRSTGEAMDAMKGKDRLKGINDSDF